MIILCYMLNSLDPISSETLPPFQNMSIQIDQTVENKEVFTFIYLFTYHTHVP